MALVRQQNMVLDVPERPATSVWIPPLKEDQEVPDFRPPSPRSMPASASTRRLSGLDREAEQAAVYENVRRAFLMGVNSRARHYRRLSRAWAKFDEKSREWARRWEKQFINHNILEVPVRHFHRRMDPPSTEGPRLKMVVPRDIGSSCLPRRVYRFGPEAGSRSVPEEP